MFEIFCLDTSFQLKNIIFCFLYLLYYFEVHFFVFGGLLFFLLSLSFVLFSPFGFILFRLLEIFFCKEYLKHIGKSCAVSLIHEHYYSLLPRRQSFESISDLINCMMNKSVIDTISDKMPAPISSIASTGSSAQGKEVEILATSSIATNVVATACSEKSNHHLNGDSSNTTTIATHAMSNNQAKTKNSASPPSSSNSTTISSSDSPEAVHSNKNPDTAKITNTNTNKELTSNLDLPNQSVDVSNGYAAAVGGIGAVVVVTTATAVAVNTSTTTANTNGPRPTTSTVRTVANQSPTSTATTATSSISNAWATSPGKLVSKNSVTNNSSTTTTTVVATTNALAHTSCLAPAHSNQVNHNLGMFCLFLTDLLINI